VTEGDSRDRGSATVEFAVALPAVALVLGLILGCATWGVGAIRVQHAANEGARTAIVDTAANAVASAERIAGPGASASIMTDGVWIVVAVDAPAQWGPAFHAEAVARAQE
jgi:Flp pilus assembly protein TadG